MGFIESLLRREARKIVRSAVGSVTDEIIKEVKGSVKTGVNSLREGSQNNSKAPVGQNDAVDVKLRKILSQEFPQYEVREKVSPETLGGSGKFLPYDFAVYENGQPKLFIMVVYGNTCASRMYRWSKEEAERAGVTLINFVYAFENKEDYITNRLHQYL